MYMKTEIRENGFRKLKFQNSTITGTVNGTSCALPSQNRLSATKQDTNNRLYIISPSDFRIFSIKK